MGIWTAKHHGLSTTKGCHEFENYISTIFKINIIYSDKNADIFYRNQTILSKGDKIDRRPKQLSQLFLSYFCFPLTYSIRSVLNKKKMVLFDVCCSKKNYHDFVFVLECRYNGLVHEAGSRFPSGDGCNECICTTLGVPQCTKYKCYPGMLYFNNIILS